MSKYDTTRDRDQTRRYLIKTARAKLDSNVALNVTSVDELVNGIMRGESFIAAVDYLINESHYWDQ